MLAAMSEHTHNAHRHLSISQRDGGIEGHLARKRMKKVYVEATATKQKPGMMKHTNISNLILQLPKTGNVYMIIYGKQSRY
jgi:hypothetical protein